MSSQKKIMAYDLEMDSFQGSLNKPFRYELGNHEVHSSINDKEQTHSSIRSQISKLLHPKDSIDFMEHMLEQTNLVKTT